MVFGADDHRRLGRRPAQYGLALGHCGAGNGVFCFRSQRSLSMRLPRGHLRQWLAQGQRLLWFNRGMALLLAVTALWMLQGQTPGFVP